MTTAQLGGTGIVLGDVDARGVRWRVEGDLWGPSPRPRAVVGERIAIPLALVAAAVGIHVAAYEPYSWIFVSVLPVVAVWAQRISHRRVAVALGVGQSADRQRLPLQLAEHRELVRCNGFDVLETGAPADPHTDHAQFVGHGSAFERGHRWLVAGHRGRCASWLGKVIS